MITEQNFQQLDRLALIVSDMDTCKTRAPQRLRGLIDQAGQVIEAMKQDLHDIGQLPVLLAGIAPAIGHAKPGLLPMFIDAMHLEIERLLGERAGEVYAAEEERWLGVAV
jgi:hypothetical protein